MFHGVGILFDLGAGGVVVDIVLDLYLSKMIFCELICTIYQYDQEMG